KKDVFEPINPPVVNMYTCGVTVYDESHIGHARSLYIFDVIKRYLKYRGFQVKFVRNITDIDDKIINRANELKVSWDELVEKYIASYYEDLKSLGIDKADVEPRATQNIPEMIEHIRGLIDKGFAYEAGGDVYFSVRKFAEYGKLSGQSIDRMETGVRIDPTEHKLDPLDFALWKKSKENEPSWESPWSKGRPGWHIECSVMSRKSLGTDTLDIHAGGRDLIFPHHENEIAQAEALTGKPFAKYWMHGGLLTINNQKMSKSLANFVTIKNFLAQHRDADILKLFFLSAHYSSPIDYNDKKIEETKEALERILILMDKANAAQQAKAEGKKFPEIERLKTDFLGAMDDDFNTPQALAAIFELVTFTNKNIADPDFASTARDTLRELLGVLGISLEVSGSNQISDADIKKKLVERDSARREKQYALSDKIRRELEEKGVILEDAKDGSTTWRRKL
ncbi:MAG: cysteine--tRNA ligase, partial [Candidatus Omnitrophota bacterium]|nr:cysteine--tRNA ligase [Candidatus Omnitrophota bacterium]